MCVCVCVCCYVGSSDTLTDVSSLHDIEDGDNIVDDEDDDVSPCRQVAASDDRTTSDVTADNLSDLTIPDFAVSISARNQLISFYIFLSVGVINIVNFNVSVNQKFLVWLK